MNLSRLFLCFVSKAFIWWSIAVTEGRFDEPHWFKNKPSYSLLLLRIGIIASTFPVSILRHGEIFLFFYLRLNDLIVWTFCLYTASDYFDAVRVYCDFLINHFRQLYKNLTFLLSANGQQCWHIIESMILPA